MKQQNGFTLIELVVVIIILGILAVTAAPKFINLQGDARESSLKGLQGTLQGANSLVFAKAAISGKETLAVGDWAADDDDGVDIGATDVAITSFGYLQATVDEINNAVEVTLGTADTDWIVDADDADGTIVIMQNGAPASTGSGNSAVGCTLTYVQATSATVLPTYTVLDNGC